MKKSLLLTSALIFGLFTYNAKAKEENQKNISFTENKGQVVDQNYQPRADILFGGQNGALAFHLRNNGISYQLTRIDKFTEEEDLITKNKIQLVSQRTIYRVDMNWLNANTAGTILKEKALEGYDNFYTEGCPLGGALNVKSYKQISYQNIYTGIDLKWYEKGGELKYDYLCAAGSNFRQIQLEIKGAAQLNLTNKGELEIKTPLGIIIEKAPVVFQNNKALKSHWVLNKNVLSFEIENLNNNLPYVIDPAVRVWGTYYGGANSEDGRSCAVDASGNSFVAGMTGAGTSTLIATVGGHQSTNGGGTWDGFIAKFNSAGVRQWGTYYGAGGNDRGYACATDASGNVYFTGQVATSTGTAIATVGSHQPAFGGSDDAFLVKFDAAGIRQWGTYYGGSGNDRGFAIAVDNNANVIIGGYAATNTGNSVATIGSQQEIYGGGTFDAYIVKFNSSGVRQWGTYCGGNGFDVVNGITTDASGNILIAGYTASSTSTLIASLAAHQPSLGGGDDAFVAKYNSAGVRQWGTYYGDVPNDRGNSCAVDATGNVYLCGFTSGNTGTVIATLGAHQATLGGSNDGFLVKFDGAGVRQWGTYYGGGSDDQGNFCATDASGNVFLVGPAQTTTGNVIATAGAYQSVHGGGSWDTYFSKFNSSGVRQWATYYGGSGDEYPYSFSTNGNYMFMVGSSTTNTGTAIANLGSHQDIHSGGTWDAFLAKFNDCISVSPTVAINASVCLGSTINFTTTITGTTVPTYSWVGPNTFTAAVQNPSLAVSGTVNIGVYTVTLNNGGGCTETATTQITAVNPQPTVSAVTSATNYICVGESATLTANGASNYTWNPGAGTGSNIAVSPTVSTNYTVTGVDGNGCSNTAVVSQSVSACIGINESIIKNAFVELYPNPANETLHINLGNIQSDNTKIVLINCIGQTVLISNAASQHIELNLSELANGLYIVKVITNNTEVINHKLIKN